MLKFNGNYSVEFRAFNDGVAYRFLANKKGVTLLPMLIEAKNNHKILISESAVSDYPHMFMAPAENHGLSSALPKCSIEFGENGDRSLKLVKHADYIAKTLGKRGFPWRYFVITKEDGQLIENTMTARLTEPNQIEDISWIKPGLITWKWWLYS